ncbi:replication endonuclease [Burkholderia gladioli]|uniref:replication endonuclease n=1 Tax=Burkholderia gladioli TaxID=28095 RepID=UPI00163EEF4F|nr:replication endonuclease [Burkholderia gladioli]
MNNINDNNFNVNREDINYISSVKTKLSDYVENRTSLKNRFSYTDNEILKSFYDIVNQDDFQYDEIELKKKLIPEILLGEVTRIVSSRYSGNWNRYFKDCYRYFDTFSIKDLVLARLDKQSLQSEYERMDWLYFEFGLVAHSTNKSITRRRLKNIYKKKVWHAQVLLKLTGGNTRNARASYITNALLNEYKIDYAKNQSFIKEQVIIGEDKKIIPLAKATRTPEQRLAENLNIISVMEKRMIDGFDWLFITLTLEPELHPNPTKGALSYDGTAPNISAKKQKSDWNKVRALLKKKDILPEKDYWGVIVSEAHKDGCQHLHILFFYRVSMYQSIRDSFFHVFPNLNDNQRDKKCSFSKNSGKAKASSYCFKYICKATSVFDPNMDIWGMKKTVDGKPVKVERGIVANSAFRSYNGIRGIGFFGIANCLTKWRFLARNQDRFVLDDRLKRILEEQDLYSFIQEKQYDRFDNVYIDTKDKTKKFIGLNMYVLKKGLSSPLSIVTEKVFVMKRFYAKTVKSMFHKNSLFDSNRKYLISELSKLAKAKALEVIQLTNLPVLVNPSYSRGGEDPPETYGLYEDDSDLLNFI